MKMRSFYGSHQTARVATSLVESYRAGHFTGACTKPVECRVVPLVQPGPLILSGGLRLASGHFGGQCPVTAGHSRSEFANK